MSLLAKQSVQLLPRKFNLSNFYIYIYIYISLCLFNVFFLNNYKQNLMDKLNTHLNIPVMLIQNVATSLHILNPSEILYSGERIILCIMHEYDFRSKKKPQGVDLYIQQTHLWPNVPYILYLFLSLFWFYVNIDFPFTILKIPLVGLCWRKDIFLIEKRWDRHVKINLGTTCWCHMSNIHRISTAQYIVYTLYNTCIWE